MAVWCALLSLQIALLFQNVSKGYFGDTKSTLHRFVDICPSDFLAPVGLATLELAASTLLLFCRGAKAVSWTCVPIFPHARGCRGANW